MYRIMPKYYGSLPTCVVAGPSRAMVWLYVHGPAPTILRLHPPVVRFLLDTLAMLDEPADSSVSWSLPRDTSMSYPECAVVPSDGRGQAAWLYVFAATPSAVPLRPRLVRFLLEALAELPALSSRAVTVHVDSPVAAGLTTLPTVASGG